MLQMDMNKIDYESIGQRERATQNRAIQLFRRELGYRYLGNWEDRPDNRNIETSLLTHWLKKRGLTQQNTY